MRVSDINFRDEYAKKKFILLANEYYSKSSDSLVLSSDKCPTRKQNREYLMYLLKVLYLESHVSSDNVCFFEMVHLLVFRVSKDAVCVLVIRRFNPEGVLLQTP